MNKCIFSGRTVKDPTLYGEGESLVARTRFAVDRMRTKDGTQKSDFLDLVAFGNRARLFAEHIPQGTYLIVETHYRENKFQKEDGQTAYSKDFIVDRIEFTPRSGSKPKGKDDAPSQNGYGDHLPGAEDDDLPWV